MRPLPWLVAAILTATVPDEARAEPVRPLRFVTLNLLHGGAFSGWSGDGQDLERRLGMVTEALRALRPDVVALQEASVARGRGHVAERLATELGLHPVYAPASSRVFPFRWANWLVASVLNFTEGPAILSRFPIVASEVRELPRCGRLTNVRVVLYAALQTNWGRLPAFSTHTSGTLCQTERVVEFVRDRRAALPGMLMGDFNAVEGSPAIAVLTTAGFVDTFRTANPRARGFTVWQPVRTPTPMARRRVDYLFLVPGTAVPGRVRSSRVVLNTPRRLPDGTVLWPSDHHGVLAEVELADTTEKPMGSSRDIPAGSQRADPPAPSALAGPTVSVPGSSPRRARGRADG